jgi:hypothetical protein
MAFPSTFADLQAAVIAKTRLDPNNAADVSKVKDWINQTYSRVCLETEAIQASTTQTLTPNVNQYALSATIQRMKYMVAQQAGQTFYGPPLRLTSLDEILWRRKSSGGGVITNGTATHYAFSAPNFIDVWPTPGAADTLLIYYVAAPPVLTNGTDVPQIDEPYASKLLEYGALMEAADYIKDVMSSYIYPQTFTDWLMRFRQHLSRSQGTQSLDFRLPAGNWLPHDNSTDIGVYAGYT